MEAIKIHKNILSMLSEVLESNKLKQNQEILDFHSTKLLDSMSKQKEYNSILEEVHQKLNSPNEIAKGQE
jgi:uncharacterized membrane protein